MNHEEVQAVLPDSKEEAKSIKEIAEAMGLEKSIYNVLVEDIELNDAVIHTSVNGLDIAPANIHLSGAEIELANKFRREKILNKKLEKVKDYDFIIVDTPPSLGGC
jgi:chromosome partitioning protein